ncbi:MAG: hypothetical protein KDD33_10175 [Bdellovibrionales bacterium]|nr:hypothetical protein [Bdellovibrionales bacterium]
MSIFKSSYKVICAFCKLNHRVYKKNGISALDAFLLLAVSGLFSFLIWGTADPRSLAIFALLIVIGHIFYRIRWRESVKCPHCGFDPVLYKRAPEEAAQKVKAFLSSRKDNPQYLLRPQPRIQPIIIPREEALVAKMNAKAPQVDIQV